MPRLSLTSLSPLCSPNVSALAPRQAVSHSPPKNPTEGPLGSNLGGLDEFASSEAEGLAFVRPSSFLVVPK
jgi:hypothetical protein